ncbi:uncharacterized protein EV420DRAFT_1477567 [Desarmillaria tabescens]|uniref:Uncharacterized protein n=1 Tax=Armillaria tabescens TaxID=1929756 RepID=A0AA39NA62_ARMTA|nr:uncharacterized protein EV420DRAFT_1477567 [Desarmillaria tabescens]KAK0461844.1 hypothetical protein EV420DRAFT_1477567 [Desarmillaria tabescens]
MVGIELNPEPNHDTKKIKEFIDKMFSNVHHFTDRLIGDNLRVSMNVETLVHLRATTADSQSRNADPFLVDEVQTADDKSSIDDMMEVDEHDLTISDETHSTDDVLWEAFYGPLTPLSDVEDPFNDAASVLVSPTSPMNLNKQENSTNGQSRQLNLSGLTGKDKQRARNKLRNRTCRHEHLMRQGVETYSGDVNSFSVQDLPFSSTGWGGKKFDQAQGEDIIARWPHRLAEDLKDAVKIPFTDRSSVYPWVDMDAFMKAADEFVERCMPFTEADTSSNICGDHFFCIAGHDHQNKKAPKLSPWHVKNADLIEEFFQPGTPFTKATEGANSMVGFKFPGIYIRFQNCVQYMKKKYRRRKRPVEARFGVFFNFCLNHSRRGQGIRRVQCWPHVDKANLAIGVCVIFIYGKFDHTRFCWLVIWEARPIIIQLPPGVFLVYPSSLFYHFNIDIQDLDRHLVTTKDGAYPTLENVESLWSEDEDQGSCVWFNQATMFQSAELNVTTMKAGRKA